MNPVRQNCAVFAWLVLLATLSCAGSGIGLDEFGNPLGETGIGPLEPTLTSIQQRIFTPICTQCHAGPAAPLGFSLEDGFSYQQIVNRSSVEVRDLLRVEPGAPDASYIVIKITGAEGMVGGRMPLGMPPLSTEQIAAIRQWIEDGAPEN
jgi:hypothetical protein